MTTVTPRPRGPLPHQRDDAPVVNTGAPDAVVPTGSSPAGVGGEERPGVPGVRSPRSVRLRDSIRSWARRHPVWATLSRIGLVLLSVGTSIGLEQWWGRPYNFFDLRIYRGAVVWWSHGGELYSYIAPETTLGFTYPPFAAVVLRPVGWMSVNMAGWLLAMASLISLAFIVTLLLKSFARKRGWRLWFLVGLVLPLLAATEPIRETIGFGQVNLVLAALICLDLVALRRRGRVVAPVGFWASGIWAGAGIGLGTAIKVTPALFILYLALSRQWRAAAVASGTATAATLVAWLATGRESWTYFTDVLWETGRVGAADSTPNQSLAGLLARLFDTAHAPVLLWISFALVVLVIGLSRAMSAHAEGDEFAAFTLVALTANAICPISWSHHLVFVVPAIIILLDAAQRRRTSVSALVLPRLVGAKLPRRIGARLAGAPHAALGIGVYVLFIVSPIWPYLHHLPDRSHYSDGLLGVLGENSLILAVLTLIVLLPWRPGAAPAFPPYAVRDSSPILQYRP